MTRLDDVRDVDRTLTEADSCCVLFVVDFGLAAGPDGGLSLAQLERLRNWSVLNRALAATAAPRGVHFRWIDITGDGAKAVERDDDDDGGDGGDDDVFSIQFFRGRSARFLEYEPAEPSYPPRIAFDARVGASYDVKDLAHYARCAADSLRRPDLAPVVLDLTQRMSSHDPRFILIHDADDVVFGRLPEDARVLSPSEALALALRHSPEAFASGSAVRARPTDGSVAPERLPHVSELARGRTHVGLDCLAWFAGSALCSAPTKTQLLDYISASKAKGDPEPEDRSH